MGWNINISIMVLLVQFVTAEDVLTSKQYETVLSSAQQSLQDARIQIALEQSRISEIKEKIIELDKRKDNYFLKLGITEDVFIATEKELADLILQLDSLNDVKNQKGNLDSIFNRCTNRLSALKLSGVSRIKRISSKINSIDTLLNTFVRRQQPDTLSNLTCQNDSIKQSSDTARTYTVKSNSHTSETLYGISSTVYGDPHRWNEIYLANKSVIDSTFNMAKNKIRLQNKQFEPFDLILPGQVLIIP